MELIDTPNPNAKKIETNDQLSVKLIDGTIDIKVKKIN